ncbi:MAG TPA: hypothetical protein IAC74_06660, partial [Candidatus Aphodoplasma excrementigallinarum]|nr:hypothetical protein [Candidatus Aphodoplasma excrementigallinarum]
RYVLEINKHTNVATLICRLDGRAETITADNFDEIIAKNVNEHSITETYHMIYSASAVHDVMPTTGPVSDSYIVFYVYTDKVEMVKENVEFEFSLNGSSEDIVAEIRQEKDCLRFRVSGWSGRQSNYDLNVRMTDKKTGKTETIQCNNLYIECPV